MRRNKKKLREEKASWARKRRHEEDSLKHVEAKNSKEIKALQKDLDENKKHWEKKRKKQIAYWEKELKRAQDEGRKRFEIQIKRHLEKVLGHKYGTRIEKLKKKFILSTKKSKQESETQIKKLKLLK